MNSVDGFARSGNSRAPSETFRAMMSCPLVVLPIVTSLVISGWRCAAWAYSSFRPPGPAYFLKTLKPAAACSVARWATVVPPICPGRRQVDLLAVDPERDELAQRVTLDVSDVDVRRSVASFPPSDLRQPSGDVVNRHADTVSMRGSPVFDVRGIGGRRPVEDEHEGAVRSRARRSTARRDGADARGRQAEDEIAGADRGHIGQALARPPARRTVAGGVGAERTAAHRA